VPSQTEAYRAFEMVSPGKNPGSEFLYYPQLYETLLLFFDGLQAAGPDLTPQNFLKGLSSLPPVAGGEFGPWNFQSDPYDPSAAWQLGWWNPNMTSNLDGQKGGWQNCVAGAFFAYGDPAGWGLANHTQPPCPGWA